ncbi:MAG: guanylate kinase [Bacteroidales bacterium]|nr:guanylate kinase [Bacteroidales bacterium]
MAMNLIVSAPSGSGKTTLLKKLFGLYPDRFGFSVSATTRKPRQGEQDKKDYYFLSLEDFQRKINKQDFLEYEQVYDGLYYGTLKSETERINGLGLIPVFDVDVKGGVNIKNILGNQAYSVFIMPPDTEVLKQRLINRNTETPESLDKRIQRAEMEIKYADKFDCIIVNDDLDKAVNEFVQTVNKHVLCHG